MICEICKQDFEPHHPLQKYCSDPCKKERIRQTAKEWQERNYIRKTNQVRGFNKSKAEYTFKRELVKYFLNTYCESGKYLMHLEFLYNCYLKVANHFNIKIGKRQFSRQLHKEGFKSVSSTMGVRKKGAKKEGIRLNKRGVKRFGIQNVANLDLKAETSGEACKVVLCKPGREHIIDIYTSATLYLQNKIDLKRTLENYKRLEKFLFQFPGTNFSPQIKRAAAFYYTNKKNKITQEEVKKLVGVSAVGFRQLWHFIENNKKK